MSSYFAPINVDGLQQYTQAAQLGWHQMASGAETLPALTGITVPPGATGIYVQAVTDLFFSFAPRQTGANANDRFTLVAGGTIFAEGQEAVQQFSVQLIAGTSFVVHFYTGSIGPVPLTR